MTRQWSLYFRRTRGDTPGPWIHWRISNNKLSLIIDRDYLNKHGYQTYIIGLPEDLQNEKKD